MIKILIGIPVLNNIEITRACLQHLYHNTETNRLDLNVSVLIADNGSESDVECILGSEFQETAFPIGFFNEDYAPIGISEDLEYFLRIERILMPSWLTIDRYPEEAKWKNGFCSKSIVHHNWCSTHQGPKFDDRRWDKMRKKNWKAKFGKSKKYYTELLP